VSSIPKDAPPPATLQVYNSSVQSSLDFHHPPNDFHLVSAPSASPAPTVKHDLLIVICKGICSIRNSSLHYTALNYHRLCHFFYICLSFVSSMPISKFVDTHPDWHQVMPDKISVLQNRETSKLVPLPSGKYVISCKWIFSIKVGLNILLINLKLVLWLKVIHRVLVWTMLYFFSNG